MAERLWWLTLGSNSYCSGCSELIRVNQVRAYCHDFTESLCLVCVQAGGVQTKESKRYIRWQKSGMEVLQVPAKPRKKRRSR